jgi:hypothetical protein
MGNIALDDAHMLKARVTLQRKSRLTALVACVLVFAGCAYLGLSYQTYDFSGEAMIVLLVGLFASFIVSAFQFNGLWTAQRYLRALRRCKPGSMPEQDSRQINVNNADRELLAMIASHELGEADAAGIRHFAEDARSYHIKLALFSLALSVMAISTYFIWPYFFSFAGSFYTYFPLLICLCLLINIWLRLSTAKTNALYIDALAVAYPSTSLS